MNDAPREKRCEVCHAILPRHYSPCRATKLSLVVVAFLFACTPSSAPPAPPPAGGLPPATVTAELVEAGCLSPDAPDAAGDNLASVVEAHFSDAQPDWLSCLFDGGTVTACGVPCTAMAQPAHE